MKRIITVLLAALLLFSLTACGEESGKSSLKQGSSTVSDVLNEQTAEKTDPTPTSTPAPVETAEPAPLDLSNGYIDVDLTQLSSTMVYSEVYNMVTVPELYIGKTVRMKGSFAMYHDEVTDAYYFACIIADATACCSQGIEFVLAGEHSYPEDYPELGSEITVVGTFGTYSEGENLYCTLFESSFE